MSGSDLMPFLIAGALILLGGQQAVSQEQRLATWTKADMTVDSSVLRKTTRRRSKGGTTTSYTAEISYHYKVGNRVHHDTRLRPIYLAGVVEGHGGIVQRHPVGKVVKGRHDSSNPPNAFLIAKRYNDPAFAIIGGILLGVIGLVAPKGVLATRRAQRTFGPRGW